MSQGKRHSFASMFDEVARVEIPIIQRDYAQGRPEARDVRVDFLNAIRDCLQREDGDPKANLNLDFVYGCFEKGSSTSFSVLDGQQRLTTLFLLHWYFAIREGMVDDFRQRFARDGHARFLYATRPSATEFFDALVREEFALPAPDAGTLSDSLTDSHWFFLSWRQDPTVQSCLGMLDEIHAIFVNDDSMYNRLVGPDTGHITFQFLNLPDFGLSDDLYIKMNARGKLLTPFENFKAWLIGRTSHLADTSAFDTNMDQAWLDVFWRLARSPSASSNGLGCEELFLRFFYLMAFYEASEQASGGYWSMPKPTQAWLEHLHKRSEAIPHSAFDAQPCFKPHTLARMGQVLDYFSDSPDEDDLVRFLRALLSNEYLDAAEFYLVVSAICATPVGASPVASMERQRWTRVTRNLIYNTRVDEISSFVMVIRGIHALSPHFKALYEHLVEAQFNVVGFAREQVNEEILKARLILQDPTWEPLLREAEGHAYLQGKVGFLLNFSRIEEGYSQSMFQTYAARAASVLSQAILQADDFLVQRALLTFVDYLVPQSSGRFSFCLPHSRSFRDRSENWLRVIVRPEFRQLLDQIDTEPKAALSRIIAGARCTDWRKHVVADPGLIAYCGYGLLKRDREQIFLLSKSKMSSFHVELYSYALYLELARNFAAGAAPSEVTQVTYEPVHDENYPHLVVTLKDRVVLRIRLQGAHFVCINGGAKVDTPPTIAAVLAQYAPTVPS